MKKMFIGVDPGVNGCVSVLCDDSRDVEKYMMPLDKSGKISGELLAKIFEDKLLQEPSELYVMVEDVHAIFGAAAGTTFSFGYNVGLLHGVLESLRIKPILVQPKRWQAEMWQGIPLKRVKSKTGKTMVTDTKAMSIEAAQKIFPDADLRKSNRSRVPHDGVSDSLLIAEYCRRMKSQTKKLLIRI